MKILSEKDKKLLESKSAREIALELTKECSQFKIKKLIEFLALNLEDRNLMLKIVSLVKEDKIEEAPQSTVIKPKIHLK